MDALNRKFLALMGIARRAARREGLSAVDAEDVASTALMQYLEAEESVTHPRAWVLLVARRKAWALRKKSRSQQWSTEDETSHIEAMPAHQVCLETLLDLKAALLTLDKSERTAVLGRDFEGQPLRVVARASGLSIETIKRRLTSGRTSLNRALSGRSVRRYQHVVVSRPAGGV